MSNIDRAAEIIRAVEESQGIDVDDLDYMTHAEALADAGLLKRDDGYADSYDDVYDDHKFCKPGVQDHSCSCHLNPPCGNCEECPAHDDDWDGWR